MNSVKNYCVGVIVLVGVGDFRDDAVGVGDGAFVTEADLVGVGVLTLAPVGVPDPVAIEGVGVSVS